MLLHQDDSSMSSLDAEAADEQVDPFKSDAPNAAGWLKVSVRHVILTSPDIARQAFADGDLCELKPSPPSSSRCSQLHALNQPDQ